MTEPKLLKVFLPEGSLEGVRVIELSESLVKAFVIPRIKLNSVKDRVELQQPALYLLISSGNNQVYIGESENCFYRIKHHDQDKDFWDIAVAIVSSTNSLEKGDVKYLESLTVERAQETSAMEVLNKTIPKRNNIHEFKVHSMESFLDDVALVVESLGYSLFSTKQNEQQEIWYCDTKLTKARAQYRGENFVVLAGSQIDKSYAPSWAKAYPYSLRERDELLQKHAKDIGDMYELQENIPFKSPNQAGGFATGRNVNAWVTWKDKDGVTMDEVIRKEV